jgi:geranylgeranyl diphosphate synthase type I
VFGNSQKTGKPNDEDLREGKRTVLVAVATQSGSFAQREVLARVLGNPHATTQDLAEVREILVDTGASSQVERMITRRVTQATSALEAGVIDEQARDVLHGLILAATQRAS